MSVDRKWIHDFDTIENNEEIVVFADKVERYGGNKPVGLHNDERCNVMNVFYTPPTSPRVYGASVNRVSVPKMFAQMMRLKQNTSSMVRA